MKETENKMQYIFPLPVGKSFVVTPSINMLKHEIVFDCMEGLPGDLVKIGTLLKNEDLFRTEPNFSVIQNELKDGVYEIYAKKIQCKTEDEG